MVQRKSSLAWCTKRGTDDTKSELTISIIFRVVRFQDRNRRATQVELIGWSVGAAVMADDDGWMDMMEGFSIFDDDDDGSYRIALAL